MPDDPETIDVTALFGMCSRDELLDELAAVLSDVGRLTAALKAKHPLAMGKDDGAIDTAIRLLERCTCRD